MRRSVDRACSPADQRRQLGRFESSTVIERLAEPLTHHRRAAEPHIARRSAPRWRDRSPRAQGAGHEQYARFPAPMPRCHRFILQQPGASIPGYQRVRYRDIETASCHELRASDAGEMALAVSLVSSPRRPVANSVFASQATLTSAMRCTSILTASGGSSYSADMKLARHSLLSDRADRHGCVVLTTQTVAFGPGLYHRQRTSALAG